MDVENILNRKSDSVARFKTLQEKRDGLQRELNDADNELIKLQGEYRAYEAIIKDFNAKGAEEVTDAE